MSTATTRQNWRRCMDHEPLFLLPEVKNILETLLAQAEQPGRKRVTRIHLNAQSYGWYYAGSRRYSVNEQVQLLEAKGWMRQLLDQQETYGGWFDSFVSWARTQLDANKSIAPLSLQDLRESQDLLTALSAIATL